MKKFLIVCGQEGAGKTTFASTINSHADKCAALDAEEVGQVNPWVFDDAFVRLLFDNVLDVVHNFFEHDYEKVVAGSFINTREDFDNFRKELKYDPEIYILILRASKEVRDKRRLARKNKPTDQEMMDWVDENYSFEKTLQTLIDTPHEGVYQLIEVDNSNVTNEQAIEEVKKKIPDFFN